VVWIIRMAGSHVLQKLKQLDAYPKINEDFYSRTLSGGILTIISATIMVLLFLSELRKCCALFLMLKPHFSVVVCHPARLGLGFYLDGNQVLCILEFFI
jgi:hypothetical protein